MKDWKLVQRDVALTSYTLHHHKAKIKMFLFQEPQDGVGICSSITGKKIQMMSLPSVMTWMKKLIFQIIIPKQGVFTIYWMFQVQ